MVDCFNFDKTTRCVNIMIYNQNEKTRNETKIYYSTNERGYSMQVIMVDKPIKNVSSCPLLNFILFNFKVYCIRQICMRQVS